MSSQKLRNGSSFPLKKRNDRTVLAIWQTTRPTPLVLGALSANQNRLRRAPPKPLTILVVVIHSRAPATTHPLLYIPFRRYSPGIRCLSHLIRFIIHIPLPRLQSFSKQVTNPATHRARSRIFPIGVLRISAINNHISRIITMYSYYTILATPIPKYITYFLSRNSSSLYNILLLWFYFNPYHILAAIPAIFNSRINIPYISTSRLPDGNPFSPGAH